MRVIRLVALTLALCAAGHAEQYLLNGGQSSEIRYIMTQDFIPADGVSRLVMSYVIPKNFTSPSYSQTIRNFDLRFSIPPASRRTRTDSRGNEILQVEWENPRATVRATLSCTAVNRTDLKPLRASAPFPLTGLEADVRPYLLPTKMIPSAHPDILKQARRLTASSRTEFDAVQRILSWLVDRVNYVQYPEKYDAVWSLRTGKGNCQNYSHLAATLMRAVGIPVRIVNGVTLKQPYEMKMPGGTFAMRMAQGRHSWIEVYFPNLGWIPFDPQQCELFVSNRFIRVEVGLDNEETVNDGAVRWKRIPGGLQMPLFQEIVNAEFVQDKVDLSAERQPYGPKKLLFSPRIESAFESVAFVPEQEAAPVAEPVSRERRTYNVSDTTGNLEFPRGEDFTGLRKARASGAGDEFTLNRSFVVETAEYVTGNGERYGQTFILDRPMQIEKIGLALHPFGGSGDLWLELLRDDGDGKPGPLIETSDLSSVETMKAGTGYDWKDFPFSGHAPELDAGRYWMVLCYSGSPIVNWFFTYGKPVGPNDGTRFNTMFEENWSRSLSYEFNYRVIGKTAR
jgi:hypothetical protein